MNNNIMGLFNFGCKYGGAAIWCMPVSPRRAMGQTFSAESVTTIILAFVN